MRRAGWRGGFGFAMLSLAAVALCAVLGVSAYNEVKDIRRVDADSLLASFQQTIELKLKGSLGETGDLTAALEVDPDDEAGPGLGIDLVRMLAVDAVAEAIRGVARPD